MRFPFKVLKSTSSFVLPTHTHTIPSPYRMFGYDPGLVDFRLDSLVLKEGSYVSVAGPASHRPTLVATQDKEMGDD